MIKDIDITININICINIVTLKEIKSEINMRIQIDIKI